MRKISITLAAVVVLLTGCGGEGSAPGACLDALDAADRLNATVEEYLDHALAGAQAGSDALRAAAHNDATGIDAATADMDEATQRITDMAPKLGENRGAYERAAALCRSK